MNSELFLLSIFGALVSVTCASAIYYHPSDPCNLVPYDYLRTQLCCNGTVYADPPFIYTCCYDFVCYRVNNMPVDPDILHPISHYFPAVEPSLASGAGAKPGVPIPKGIFVPPEYETQEPEVLQSPNNKLTKSAKSDTSFGSDAVAGDGEAETDGNADSAAAPAPEQAIKPSYDAPPMNQFSSFPGFGQFPQQPQQYQYQYQPQGDNPYYMRNQGPVHQYFLPLGKEVWSPFQSMFQRPQEAEQQTTTAPATASVASEVSDGTTKSPTPTFPPNFLQFLQNFFPREMNFPSVVTMPTPAPIEDVVTATTTTESSEDLCDGINLKILQQANPSLACCAKMVIYDSRLYSCVESEATTSAPTTGAANGEPVATETTKTTPILIPTTITSRPASTEPPPSDASQSLTAEEMIGIKEYQELPVDDSNVDTYVGQPAVDDDPSPDTAADQASPDIPDTAQGSGAVERQIITPAKRSAKVASIKNIHHNHLPADFVPLTCGIHEYYIDPSISTKYACCGDAIFDVTLELCEHVWGMYYAMAAVPIDEEEAPPSGPARLDCSELKTYIFGNPSTAANYSC